MTGLWCAHLILAHVLLSCPEANRRPSSMSASWLRSVSGAWHCCDRRQHLVTYAWWFPGTNKLGRFPTVLHCSLHSHSVKRHCHMELILGVMLCFNVVWCIHSHWEIVPHHPIRSQQTRLQSWQEKILSSKSSHFLGSPCIWCGSNRARRQSGFPTFISCQHQDPNVLPEQRQSHQGDKLCDVSTVPLVARWPVLLARGSHLDGEPHWIQRSGESQAHSVGFPLVLLLAPVFLFFLFLKNISV